MGTESAIVTEIMKHMPKGAEKYLVENGSSGFVLSVHWKLKDDPERPNRYSKTIVVFISRELLEDLPNYPASMQQSALQKISSWTAAKFKAFDPSHDVPKYLQPPSEQWTIPVDRLFG